MGDERKELLKGLFDLADVVGEREELTARVDALTAKRDLLIRSTSASGGSRRTVAEAAGLTAGRIQQMLEAAGEAGPITASGRR